jgi:hypothetical protein
MEEGGSVFDRMEERSDLLVDVIDGGSEKNSLQKSTLGLELVGFGRIGGNGGL